MRCRSVIALAGSAVLVTALTSCSASPPAACTAIGISYIVRVRVSGDTSRVADVGFCGGAACTPQRLALALSDSTPSPLPLKYKSGVWSVPTGHATPGVGHVAAFDTHGSIIADSRVHLVWHNKGTETCPGPYEASTSLLVEG